MELNTETFHHEINNAMLSYDRHVVCVFKTPDECLEAIERLMIKAIKAYENRAEGMRHGIALDKEITIMLSQSGATNRCARSTSTCTPLTAARTAGATSSSRPPRPRPIHRSNRHHLNRASSPTQISPSTISATVYVSHVGPDTRTWPIFYPAGRCPIAARHGAGA